MIPEAAVEAAADKLVKLRREGEHSSIEYALAALEAAAPHMLGEAKADALEELAADVCLRIDQIEAHQVPESEYGTLLAQREEAVSIYRDIRARAASYRPTP